MGTSCGSVARFTQNAPVWRMLRSVSFSTPPRLPMETETRNGVAATALK
jgi:hypothetical protein